MILSNMCGFKIDQNVVTLICTRYTLLFLTLKKHNLSLKYVVKLLKRQPESFFPEFMNTLTLFIYDFFKTCLAIEMNYSVFF